MYNYLLVKPLPVFSPVFFPVTKVLFVNIKLGPHKVLQSRLSMVICGVLLMNLNVRNPLYADMYWSDLYVYVTISMLLNQVVNTNMTG